MISAEVPVLFSKAIEMFISEMTIKGYYNAEKCDRKTLLKKDIAMTIVKTETYDFLIDTLPKDELLKFVSPDALSPYQNALLNTESPIYDFPNYHQ